VISPTGLKPGDKIEAKVILDVKAGPMRTFKGEVRLGENIIATCNFDIVLAGSDAIPAWDGNGVFHAPPDSAGLPEQFLQMGLTLNRTQLFLDAFNDINLSKGQVKARYTHPIAHPINEGHYPGNPIFMGIKQITAARQALEVFAIRAKGDGVAGFERAIPFAALGFDKVEWANLVRPGIALDIDVSNIKSDGQIVSADARVVREDGEVASTINGLKIKLLG